MSDCVYSVPDLDASGDALYGPRICNQPFIDYAWDDHGFNSTYWQGGWGFSDPCNVTKPLARAFNAMWLLAYSAQDWQNEDWGSDALHWGPRFVREQLSKYDDLRAQCGDGTAVAVTSGCQATRKLWHYGCTEWRDDGYRSCRSWSPWFAWLCFIWFWVAHKVCVLSGWIADLACTIWYGTVGGGQHVELTLWFFYPLDGRGTNSVAERAGVLMHESRHIANHPHDAQFPPGSIYGSGDGADSSWQYEGAWMYEALYLWWFTAAGVRTSIGQKNAAKQEANIVLANAFATSPGFMVP